MQCSTKNLECGVVKELWKIQFITVECKCIINKMLKGDTINYDKIYFKYVFLIFAFKFFSCFWKQTKNSHDF